MEFNETPDLDIIKKIKQAQRKGQINKPTILKALSGSITSYNPFAMFTSEVAKQISEVCEDGYSYQTLQCEQVTLNRISGETLLPKITDYVTYSVVQQAGSEDNILGLLNCMAKALEDIMSGKYSSMTVELENIYVFTSYEIKEKIGVIKEDVIVIPLHSN